jgi:hypothetical protein
VIPFNRRKPKNTLKPARSKYGAKKTVIDGIQFDSQSEGRYYEELVRQKGEGLIKDFTLQPQFTLLDSFELNGKKIRPIKYIADFEVHHFDGRVDIIDIKGIETPDFKIKKKLFQSKFNRELICLKRIVKYGGWITLDEEKRIRKQEKKDAKND